MFILLALSVTAASLYSVLLHRVNFKEHGSVFLFNLMTSAVWCLALLIVNGGALHLNRNVLVFGILYGITQALFILFKAKAMNEGAVSLTTLIGNCSLLLSVFACLILWDEPISPADLLGLLVLFAGILLTTYRKSARRFTGKWAIYALLFLIFGAAIGLVFKAFSKSGSHAAGDMMIVASLTMLLSYSLVCLVNRDFSTKLPPLLKEKSRAFLLTALLAGILSCAYNRLNIYLSGAMIGAVFFPCFNGGVVVLSTTLSVLILRERLRAIQVLGIALGIAGICVIGIL